jgi:putative transposase
MCRVLKVSRSGFYDWRRRAPSRQRKRREELAARIRAVFDDSDSTYGYRRIHAVLAGSGIDVDDDTVRTIMQDLGLVTCQPRKAPPITTVACDAADVPDRVRRDFTADAPARKVVGDITYIRTWEGWLYLATVLDCFSKKVVGYAMSDKIDTPLVCAALDNAANRSTFVPGITIFHSDRGCQYTSDAFKKTCEGYGILRSLGRTGICYDNAWAESFNGTLKNERVNRTVYPTREHAQKDVTRYIELWYNSKRLHSTLGYRIPDDIEAEWFDRYQAA